jgi:hypothetical protein
MLLQTRIIKMKTEQTTKQKISDKTRAIKLKQMVTRLTVKFNYSEELAKLIANEAMLMWEELDGGEKILVYPEVYIKALLWVKNEENEAWETIDTQKPIPTDCKRGGIFVVLYTDFYSVKMDITGKVHTVVNFTEKQKEIEGIDVSTFSNGLWKEPMLNYKSPRIR